MMKKCLKHKDTKTKISLKAVNNNLNDARIENRQPDNDSWEIQRCDEKKWRKIVEGIRKSNTKRRSLFSTTFGTPSPKQTNILSSQHSGLKPFLATPPLQYPLTISGIKPSSAKRSRSLLSTGKSPSSATRSSILSLAREQ